MARVLQGCPCESGGRGELSTRHSARADFPTGDARRGRRVQPTAPAQTALGHGLCGWQELSSATLRMGTPEARDLCEMTGKNWYPERNLEGVLLLQCAAGASM